MNIVVCMKQVPDPEGPPSAFEVDEEGKKVIPRGIPPVLSPFDENALEAALRLKANRGAKVTVLSMGKNVSKAVLSKAVAAGADEMIFLQDKSFADLDSYATASGLAAAVRKIGAFDLILCGRQASDSDAGQVHYGIAELLGIPCITPAQEIEPANGKIRIQRLVPDGYEVLEVELPVVVGVSNECYEFRYVSFRALSKAQQKLITTWSAEDVGIDVSGMKKLTLTRLFARVSETRNEVISGVTPAEVGVNLALKLREAKVI